ncbi:MAG: M14 family zinc carboxypeptidase [Planctomycetia bacterium]|nr:M14 family zinc carboxypeptidase [Planctomycetia bacterium]
MNAKHGVVLAGLLLLGWVGLAWAEIQVDGDFPGGNVVVDSINPETNVVQIRPRGNYFFFTFRVRGAEGRTLQFEFEPGSHRLGSLGPAVCSNLNPDWKFLFAEKNPEKRQFRYTFAPGETSVFFAHAIPYTQQNWDAFLEPYRLRQEIRLETLCRSRSGKREVEMLRISPKNPNARFFLAFTARHHACEVPASYAMEGMIQEFLADTPEGKWLRENTECVFIPFMDKDGVEEGDQGKNRMPHDHNRDYIQEIYPTVKAFKKVLREEPQGKPFVFMDMHAPWIRDNEHEQLFSLGPETEKFQERWNRFRVLLQEKQAGGALSYDRSWDIPAGVGYNQTKNFIGDGTLLSSNRWAQTLPNAYCAFSMEFPYALCGGGVMTPQNARELGRNIAKAWASLLREEVEKVQAR